MTTEKSIAKFDSYQRCLAKIYDVESQRVVFEEDRVVWCDHLSRKYRQMLQSNGFYVSDYYSNSTLSKVRWY